MDVINAQAVNGTFGLIHHDLMKDGERKNSVEIDEYFWRQTVDFTTGTLTVRLVVNHAHSDTDMFTEITRHASMMQLSIRTA
jgi:hypothetical protein